VNLDLFQGDAHCEMDLILIARVLKNAEKWPCWQSFLVIFEEVTCSGARCF